MKYFREFRLDSVNNFKNRMYISDKSSMAVLSWVSEKHIYLSNILGNYPSFLYTVIHENNHEWAWKGRGSEDIRRPEGILLGGEAHNPPLTNCYKVECWCKEKRFEFMSEGGERVSYTFKSWCW